MHLPVSLESEIKLVFMYVKLCHHHAKSADFYVDMSSHACSFLTRFKKNLPISTGSSSIFGDGKNGFQCADFSDFEGREREEGYQIILIHDRPDRKPVGMGDS